MLSNVVQMLTQGVTFLGGVLVVFGLINLGMTIKDGMQGGGGQLSGAIAMIVGGAIVVGAAIYFGQLNTCLLYTSFGEVPVSWRIPAHLDGRE